MEHNRDKIISKIISDNQNNLHLVFVGGIPGSGKSTIAKVFRNNGYEVSSTDECRYKAAQKDERYKDMSESEISDEILCFSDEGYEIAINQIVSAIKEKKNVVFDATLCTRKSRARAYNKIKSLTKEVDNYKIDCIYLDSDLESAIDRNIIRANTQLGISKATGEPVYGRYVQDCIIKDKYTIQVLPMKKIETQFDNVHILYDDSFKYRLGHKEEIEDIYKSKDVIQYAKDHKELINELFPEYKKCWDLDQQTKYHNLKLDDHILSVAQKLQGETLELFIAGFLHDIGKPFTKARHGFMIMDSDIFKAGEKVTIDKIDSKGFVVVSKYSWKDGYRTELVTVKHVAMNANYNYYSHQNVGARLARKYLKELGYEEDQCNLIYRYILHHMDIPIDMEHSNKTLKKTIGVIGKDIAEDMIKIKFADKSSSNTGQDELKSMTANAENIRNILKSL